MKRKRKAQKREMTRRSCKGEHDIVEMMSGGLVEKAL